MLDVRCSSPFWPRIAIAALLVLPFLNFPSSAQTNATRDLSSRFLFIVDTSAAMGRCAPATLKAVGNLLRSSISAQLRRGDTVGVWTFDEALNAGRFPLQQWSPERMEAVASNVVAFLQAQRYQNQSRYDVIAPALERIVRDSDKLTVLLVTDGDEKISGTPYDRQIQNALSQNFKSQQKARMPFITVLRASRGQFINASVNLAPWPVDIPAFPPEPKVAESPKLKPPEKKPAALPTIPSLIVIGEKTISPPAATAPDTASTNLVATALPATSALVKVETSSPPGTSLPASVDPGEIKPSPAPIPSATPNETASQSAATTPPDSGTPSTTPLAAPAPIEANKAPPIAAVETKPAPVPASAQSAELQQSPPATTPIESVPIAPTPETPLPAPTKSPENVRARSDPPAPIALAVQPEPGFSRMGMVGIGVAVMVLAGGFFFTVQRRARNAAHASLITRSMNQDHK